MPWYIKFNSEYLADDAKCHTTFTADVSKAQRFESREQAEAAKNEDEHVVEI